MPTGHYRQDVCPPRLTRRYNRTTTRACLCMRGGHCCAAQLAGKLHTGRSSASLSCALCRQARLCHSDTANVRPERRVQGLLRQQVAFQAETTTADSGGGFRCSLTTTPVDAVVSGWHVVVPELVLADEASLLFPRATSCVQQTCHMLTRVHFGFHFVHLPKQHCERAQLPVTDHGANPHAGVGKWCSDLAHHTVGVSMRRQAQQAALIRRRRSMRRL